MALDRMTGAAGYSPNIGGVKPQDGIRKNPQGTGAGSGLDFKQTLDQIASTGLGQAPIGAKPAATVGASQLKFSNHAVERMHSRGIAFGPDEMKGIENAVMKAAQKGSKDTLILSGENALIVSVKNNTVVTVMDRAAMKDNVFTNIDSTVVL